MTKKQLVMKSEHDELVSMKLQKQPERLGIEFWLPASLANGALVIVLFGMVVLVDGEEWIQARFHTSFLGLSVALVVTSFSIGILGGLINPYLRNRWQATLAGVVSVFPGALAFAIIRSAATRGLLHATLGAVLAACLVGGLYGAVAYRR